MPESVDTSEMHILMTMDIVHQPGQVGLLLKDEDEKSFIFPFSLDMMDEMIKSLTEAKEYASSVADSE